MPINTKSAPRRALSLSSAADVLAELDRIEAAHRAGTLNVTGNWTPGTILNHLAVWINFAFDGYPPDLRTPWIIKFIMGFRRKAMIDRVGQFSPGVRIPGLADGTLGTEPASFEQGLVAARAAWKRLQASAPTHPSPLFGPMTHQQWLNLNLAHANLHLSFLSVENVSR